MGQSTTFLLFTLLCTAATAKRRATLTTGNGTQSVDDGLFARDVFARVPSNNLIVRQACNAPGWGQCDSGQCCPLNAGCCGYGCINTANTCCDNGGVCPPQNGCCYGSCAPPGWSCCGYNGNIYPLDGSECCSDGRHCNPGESCGACNDGSGLICCYGNGDDSGATYSTELATYTGGESYSTEYSTSYSASYDYTTTTTAADSTITAAPTTSDSYYTSTGDEYTWSYYSTTFVYYFYTWYFSAYYESMSSYFSSETSDTTTITVFASDYADATYKFAVTATSVQDRVEASASSEGASARASYTSMSQTSAAAGGGGYSAGVRDAHVGHTAWMLMAAGLLVGSLAVIL